MSSDRHRQPDRSILYVRLSTVPTIPKALPAMKTEIPGKALGSHVLKLASSKAPCHAFICKSLNLFWKRLMVSRTKT